MYTVKKLTVFINQSKYDNDNDELTNCTKNHLKTYIS